MPTDVLEHRYRGARAMILLHDEHLRKFLATWKQAQAKGLVLPKSEDPSYASLDALLTHVLGAGRGYITWMCEQLGLPDPGIPPRPEVPAMAAQADAYLEQVLQGWRQPLRDIPEARFDEEYPSRWKVRYCIDAMMEHAVMHPIRHTFQLEELMGER